MPAPIGLIVNPASGRDMRRLVSLGATVGNAEKVATALRAIAGAAALGVDDFILMPDGAGVAQRIQKAAPAGFSRMAAINVRGRGTDARNAAAAMRQAGCAAVIVLGGDGTCREAAGGLVDVPMLALSTGTNNAFPEVIEGTLAGMAAGALACRLAAAAEVCRRAPILRLSGAVTDHALVDAALVDTVGVGAGAVWEVERVRKLALARPSTGCIGLSAIGGFADPAAPQGLGLTLGTGGRTVTAPIAPGVVRRVDVLASERLSAGSGMTFAGPGTLALDGERLSTLRLGEVVRVTLCDDGPVRIDVTRCLAAVADVHHPHARAA
jgi:hypothetical protein